MNPPGTRSAIETIEKDLALYEEKNFEQRAEAIDFLEFHVIAPHPEELKTRAKKLKTRLEESAHRLFEKLREGIRSRKFSGSEFRKLVSKYVKINNNDEPGYDNLDIFINLLLHSQPLPQQTKDPEPEMVFYQKTPARIVFQFAEKINISASDVFFDIGSGLGQAAILVNLLTGVKTIGIEFEPAFCDFASDNAATLNLRNVAFTNIDARAADYSKGTIFFMYTPFTGDMLLEVLKLLRQESLLRKITVITYGPCTPQVAVHSWLRQVGHKETGIYKPAIFTSL